LINDTLAANTATGSTADPFLATSLGGGIFNDGSATVHTLNLVNTIVFNPSGAATDPDVSGPITATQNSLFSSNVASQIDTNGDLGGNQLNANPMLGPLQGNGGPTQTLALLPGSPAIHAGTSISPLGDIPTTDQRGLPRPQGATDIGAFQVQAMPTPPTPTPTPAPRDLVATLQQVGKKKVLFVVVRLADTGAVKAMFKSPFQGPAFKNIQVRTTSAKGNGVTDTVVLTARRNGKLKVRLIPV